MATEYTGSKHYFELDKVNSITLRFEKESEYRWYEEVPSRPRKMFGIKIGTIAAIPAGWNSEEPEEELRYSHRRVSSSYFERYKWYRVDETKKRVFEKAYIEIVFGYKQTISTKFETNEEAQEYVNELIQSSEKEFHVIIK